MLRHLLKRAALCIAVAALLQPVWAPATPAAAGQRPAVAERLKPVFPALALPRPGLSGQAAVDGLGARLGDVAAWYGKTREQLRDELVRDTRMRVDGKGRLFVVDELERPLAGSSAPALQRGALDGQLAPLDQTFLLHSKPGADKTIVLNFRGATLTNTAWNSNGNTINAQPFDIDGNPASFSDDEYRRIQYIWQRVAEDYAPFDVDVTTELVSQDRISRAGSLDPIFGTTVLITNSTGVYSCSCGGVAYVGVFNMTDDYYKPALVFYNQLGSGDEKYVAEAISHEAGHNMGLSHDGSLTSSYYQGQGSDPVTGWAPIMGVGYYKPLVQFSKGEYLAANNREDDFAVMQSTGLPLRADDYGSTITDASGFAGSGGSLTSGSMEGVIETAADRDLFAVNSGTGTLSASVAPAARSPNADLVLSLLDANGAVLATSNPLNALNASLSYQVTAPGTLYLEVKGTGQGSAASTGYSAYGSVGNYKLSASYVSAGSAGPVALLSSNTTSGVAPLAISFDASLSSDDGAITSYLWDFGDGSTPVSGGATIQKTYATPGTYTARVTVTDNSGLTSSATRTITVTSPVIVKTLKVSSIVSTFKVSATGAAAATAVVTVVNDSAQPMANATVYGTWSGRVSGSTSLRTNTRGQASFTSPSSKLSGCFRLTVTNITLTGYSFDTSGQAFSEICR